MKNKLKVIYNNKVPDRYLYGTIRVKPMYPNLRDGLYMVRISKGYHLEYYIQNGVWHLIPPLSEEDKKLVESYQSQDPLLSEDEKDELFRGIVRELRKQLHENNS